MASIKQLNERNDNISAIISFVRRNGSATRAEICKAVSLSWACVSDLVALLIEKEILVESLQETKGTSAATKGRCPCVLALNGRKYFLGVDINDSGIAVTTLSISGRRIASRRWEEELFESEDALMRSVCEKIAEMMFDEENCCGIGVAMEGMNHAAHGGRYPLRQGWVPVFPEAFLQERFGLPISVKHDPECVLYSVANHCEDCIVVRVDKWVGIAAMRGGKILELPLELGKIRCGDKRLHDILRGCADKGNYLEIAEALGRSVGNLSLILGIKTCFLAGEVTEWIDGVIDTFEAALRGANSQCEYEICLISDASHGAAKLAMADFTIQREAAAE